MDIARETASGKVKLTLREATFARQNQIVFARINWQLQPNEQWAVYGSVGSGKTTFLEALVGRLPLQSGAFEVMLRDTPAQAFSAADRSALRGQAGLVSFQQDSFFNYGRAFYQQRYQSLESELAIPTVQEILQKALPDGSIPELDRIAALMQLTELLPVEVIKLSNGQTRKLQIARALLRQPKLLLLDNPFTGLDVASRRHLKEVIDALIDQGTEVLLATNQTELPEKTTHILWLENFKVKGIYTRAAFYETLASLPKAPHSNQINDSFNWQPAEKISSTFAVAVKMEDVNVQYLGKQVLQHISWTVNRGQKWALIGPNGSGKSTLLSLIYADNPQAFANKITLFDRRKGTGESIWDIKKRIGFVSPELHLYFRKSLTGAEVAATGFTDTLTRNRYLTAKQRQIMEQHFAYFNRADLLTKPFLQLSAGEQRLILLIRSLVKNPDLIIWDEPFQGLSPEYIAKATSLLKHYCTDETTLILVTHYSHEIPDFVSHYLYLEAGQIQRVVNN